MKILVCVCVVAYREDGFIATSARRHDPNQWCLPGGKIEPEDGTEEELTNNLELVLRRAAARELLEETGVIVEVGLLVELYGGVCRDESGSGDPDTITITYEAVEWTGELASREGEPEAKWHDWGELTTRGAFKSYNNCVLDAARSL